LNKVESWNWLVKTLDPYNNEVVNKDKINANKIKFSKKQISLGQKIAKNSKLATLRHAIF
jgi:hypothetical protein